jgi:hypothetical protein
VTGTAGSAAVPAFAVPHMDNRILVTRDGSTEEDTLGDQTSYTYQLAVLENTLQSGAAFLIDVDDSVLMLSSSTRCFEGRASHLAARRGRVSRLMPPYEAS